jgi:hypothetical protein
MMRLVLHDSRWSFTFLPDPGISGFTGSDSARCH